MDITTPVIRPVDGAHDLDALRVLWREYANGLGVDLWFQGFDAELVALPGKYAVPAGRLLLAWAGTQAVGCAALRPLDARTCEMKRLYVRQGARGGQLGRRLAERICQEARDIGYARICLDTLPGMAPAQALYQSLGFRSMEPYVFNPIPGARFLGLDL